MSTFSLTEESKFIKTYYEFICNDINKTTSLYSNTYKCVITKENQDNFKPASLSKSFPSPIFKIFVSSISSLEVDGKYFLSVLGQFVYVDRTQQRVSHQLVLKRVENGFVIEGEKITFLDEEIVYDAYDSRICLSHPKKEFFSVVQDISKVALIESCEQKGGKFVLKINRHNMPYDVFRGKIEGEGYKFEKIN